MNVFLSTPSVWRATSSFLVNFIPPFYFYPRPPCGGRRECFPVSALFRGISIHALRVEGDRCTVQPAFALDISIHALRVEGDGFFKVVYAA